VKRTPLAACPACARHVRVDEPVCPFCHARLPPSFRERTTPPPPATRLSRAALYALRAGALSVTTVACGGAVSTGSDGKDRGGTTMSSVFDAAYGGPPSDASEEDGDQADAPTGLDSAYGGFFAVDAEPAYGGPFPEPAYGGIPVGWEDATSPVQVGCPDAEPDGVTCFVDAAQPLPLDASVRDAPLVGASYGLAPMPLSKETPGGEGAP